MLGLNKISQFTNYWQNKGFEIVIIISFLFLGGCALIFWLSGRKGTYSKDGYFVLPQRNNTEEQKRGPPQESKKKDDAFGGNSVTYAYEITINLGIVFIKLRK